MNSLPGLERISSSCSSSSLYTISTQASSPDTLMMDDPLSCFDYHPTITTTTTTITASKKRKRQNSTMIIKPTRWSPPQQRQSTRGINNDFKPTFYNPNEIKHRRRVSSQQYDVLEEEYRINTKPNASKRHQLAERLGMAPRTVQIWFQNKRAKAKQQSKLSPNESTSNATTSSTLMTFDAGRLDPIYLESSPAITKCGSVLPAPMADSEVGDHGTIESSSSLSSPLLPSASDDTFPMWLHPSVPTLDPFDFLQHHMGHDQRHDSILDWIQKTPTDPWMMNQQHIIQNNYLDFALD